MKWGHDLCFCVAGKMFTVVSLERPHSIAFKCTPETFGELVERPGIIPAPYMARNMWVQEQELGVRMALGAQPTQVLWLVLRRGLIQLAIGLPLGVAGAFGVGKLLESLLVQTSARDPLTLIAITALLIVVSVVACLWPARRATRLDPVSALRYE